MLGKNRNNCLYFAPNNRVVLNPRISVTYKGVKGRQFLNKFKHLKNVSTGKTFTFCRVIEILRNRFLPKMVEKLRGPNQSLISKLCHCQN